MEHIQPLFTVVIPHYSKTDLWKQTVDSVLAQDYPAIEIIFADDCSPGFDLVGVEEYIRGNAGNNLLSYKVISGDVNLGTVANLYNSHRLCRGEYLTHIAGDDVYVSNSVLSRFAELLAEKDEGVLGVYGQSLFCDKNLKLLNRFYFDPQIAEEMNSSAQIQHFTLTQRCCFPMGATAFIFDEYLQYELTPDDGYKLIEDWPFFVRATRAGKRFVYGGFDVLLYRDGGVSRSSEMTATRYQCIADTVLLYEQDIMPYLQLFSLPNQLKVYHRYNQDRIDFSKEAGEMFTQSRIGLLLNNPKLGVALLKERCLSAKTLTVCFLVWLVCVVALLLIKPSLITIVKVTVWVLAMYSTVRCIRTLLNFRRYLFSKKLK